MTRIQNAFKHRNALIAFLTAGDPSLEVTAELVRKMEEKGADMIELGIPFSDSIAEESAIQESNGRALTNGTTTDRIFDMVVELRKTVKIPIVFLTYLNPIYTYGSERFLKNCKESGVDGIIVLDLPFEEKEELSGVCKRYGVSLISMVAPASKERIARITKEAVGFLPCIPGGESMKGHSKDKMDLESMLSLVHRTSKVPCVVSGGVITEEQARAAVQKADGVVVENVIVKLVERYGKNAVEPVGEYVYYIKQSMTHVGKAAARA